MTDKALAKQKEYKFDLNAPIVIFILTVAALTLNASLVRESIINGIRLSALSVIPSLFPFFILSDFLSAKYQPKNKIFSNLVCRIFGISKASVGCVILGFICGFPLGVKSATELYSDKIIDKDECERLCIIANNPSFGFVASGVGAGMFGNPYIGVILYVSVILSAVAVGFLAKQKRHKSKNISNISRQSFDLSLSIKSAALSSIYVSSYIIFFSGVLGIVSSFCKSELLKILFSSVLEIGNAASVISKSKILSPASSITLTSFALGFSGLSVFMQAVSYLPPEISKGKLLGYKLIQGAISAVCAIALYSFFC